jgi:hypothetical protein
LNRGEPGFQGRQPRLEVSAQLINFLAQYLRIARLRDRLGPRGTGRQAQDGRDDDCAGDRDRSHLPSLCAPART